MSLSFNLLLIKARKKITFRTLKCYLHKDIHQDSGKNLYIKITKIYYCQNRDKKITIKIYCEIVLIFKA